MKKKDIIVKRASYLTWVKINNSPTENRIVLHLNLEELQTIIDNYIKLPKGITITGIKVERTEPKYYNATELLIGFKSESAKYFSVTGQGEEAPMRYLDGFKKEMEK